MALGTGEVHVRPRFDRLTGLLRHHGFQGSRGTFFVPSLAPESVGSREGVDFVACFLFAVYRGKGRSRAKAFSGGELRGVFRY